MNFFYNQAFNYNIALCLGMKPVNKVGEDTILNISSWMLKHRKPQRIVYNWDPMRNFCERKLFPGWLKYLRDAEKVYDYSALNVKYYDQQSIRYEHLKMDVFDYKGEITKRKKDIDFLFYGFVQQSPRRLEVLYYLHKKYKVFSPLNNYGSEALAGNSHLTNEKMIELISRSKYVLDININVRKQRCNNGGRILPALSYGGNVIAEECDEGWFNDKIKGLGVKVVSYRDLLKL